MKEFLDVVDEKGESTGEIVERDVAHYEGVPHRTSHLWLLRRKNGRVEILLQKRAASKSFPGCYDISSAGHIPAGDDYVTSAIRELKEELGVTAEPADLVCCGDRYIVWDDVFFGKPYHDRQYTRVFLMWTDLEEDQFILQEEEVDSVLWMDLEECIDGVKNGSFENCIESEELMMVKNGEKAPLDGLNGTRNLKTYNFYGWETADVKDSLGRTPRDYYDILSELWCAETCAPRMRECWSHHDKTLGQCSITAFLMQDIYGGKVYGILRPDGNYHCYNNVDGCVFDLTSEQFGDEKLDYSDCTEQFREVHFAKEEKKQRYEYLKEKLLEM